MVVRGRCDGVGVMVTVVVGKVTMKNLCGGRLVTTWCGKEWLLR